MKNKTINVCIVIGLLIIILIYLIIIINPLRIYKYELLTDTSSDYQELLAVQIEQSDGSYASSTDIPTSGYALNETTSFCGTSNGDGTYTHDTSVTMNWHDGVMYFDNLSKRKTKCFLYFDIDTKPTISKFYIGGSSNPSSITSTSTTLYLAYSGSNVAYYCISTTNSSSSCSWVATSSSPITVSYTLSGTGTQKLYAFVKTKYGTISSSKSDSVTVGTYLKDAILANNTIDTSRSSGYFPSRFYDDTSGTIFSGTDDYGTTYFFAGANPNNWVTFAGFYWRIIRINGDGSIRLIYNGTSTSNTESNTQISTSVFNSSYSNNMYVGYMYTSGSRHGLGTGSTIKSVLDTWYSSNLKSYASYIDTDAGFCGDRQSSSVEGSVNGSGGTGTTETYYAADYRVYYSYQFTYGCTYSSDLYTVSSSSYGNNALTYPIGLITIDEVAYAGGDTRVNKNTVYWLYTEDSIYWTMTPDFFNGTYAGNFVVWTGYIEWDYVNKSAGIRPVINLKSTTFISSGSGTSSSPYIVS